MLCVKIVLLATILMLQVQKSALRVSLDTTRTTLGRQDAICAQLGNISHLWGNENALNVHLVHIPTQREALRVRSARLVPTRARAGKHPASHVMLVSTVWHGDKMCVSNVLLVRYPTQLD